MYPQLYHPGNIVGKTEVYLSVISGTHGTLGVAGASASNIAGGLALWGKVYGLLLSVMSTGKR